jgi:amidase
MGKKMEFEKMNLTQLALGLTEGSWTSEMLVTHFLDRIQRLNPATHAVVELRSKEALAEARASDHRRRSGKPLGQYDGVPLTIKDAFRVAGSRTTYGMLMFKYYRPSSNSKIIQCLLDQGMIVIGRTAVPTTCLDWNAKNQVHTECVHPLNSAFIPGGSSGGSAAAVLSGLTTVEIGSDLGGSIRYPAHCCGIYGLRTSDGWIPTDDMGPENHPTSLKHLVSIGPMTRCMVDMQVMIDMLKQTFSGRPPAVSKPKTSSVKIAYSLDYGSATLESQSKLAVQKFVSKLEKRGFIVEMANPQADPEDLYRTLGTIAGYEYTSIVPRFLRWRLVNHICGKLQLRRLGPGPFSRYFISGMLASKDEYQQAIKARECAHQAADKFFDQYDYWILPVAPASAIRRDQCGKPVKTERGLIEYSRYLGGFTVPTTLFGTPSLSFPIGNGENNLPVGVQIHGARYSDRELVDFWREFEAGA